MTSIVPVITSLCAVSFYTFILYLILPYKIVSIKQMVIFFVSGFLPFVLLAILFAVFPNIADPVHLPFTFVEKDVDEFIFFTFFQVAGVEEICKFMIFAIVLNYQTKRGKISKSENLVSFILYASVCYAGFSFLETLLKYDETYNNQRLFFSLLNHMFTGILMTYWFVLASLPKKPQRSIYYLLSNKYSNYSKYLTIFIGFVCTVFFHGIYNFNASMNTDNVGLTFHFFIVFIEIYFAVRMIDHIIRKENKIKLIQSETEIETENDDDYED